MSYSIDDQIDKILDICHIDSDIARSDELMRERIGIQLELSRAQGALDLIVKTRDKNKHFEVNP